MQREQRLLAAKELRAILAERDTLLAEVNDWRARESLPLKASSGVSAGVTAIFKVEDEVFGTFADGAMGGDGDEDEDDEQEVQSAERSLASVAIAEETPLPMFHPDFAGQSFSSNGSSLLSLASRRETPSAFFGAAVFPKLEALTPPSSADSLSPLSQNARFHAQSPDMGSDLDAADKVSSWAAEQLFNHIQSQQHQQHQHLSSPSPLSFLGSAPAPATLAGQHHAQNPYTASLLANIAATQQRAAFGMPLFDGVDDAASKAYSFPTGPSHMFPSFAPAQTQQQHQPAQLDAWRQYALAQYQLQAQGGGLPSLASPFGQQRQQQQSQGALSMDELKDAVRAGMGYGLSMVGGQPSASSQGGWAGDIDAFSV